MKTTGILLHVYHLGSADWEQLVWGEPDRDELGAGAKLFECLLAEPADSEVQIILFDGPSSKHGVSEGHYTKQFLVDKLTELERFPKLRRRWQRLSVTGQALFQERVQNIVVAGSIANTADEIEHAARYFASHGVTRVLHIAAASHAPRCIQLQATTRERGLIPADQLWYTVASDHAFADFVASDTVVIEPPHRADDPLLTFRPTLASLLKQYFLLPADQKRMFVLHVQRVLGAVGRTRQRRLKPTKVV